jgi:polar amino acid transport system substrate-binding protein
MTPERRARRAAGHRVAFVGHALIWAAVCLLLLVVAGFFPALVVALSWGIGLLAHGFFGVVAPVLHARWVGAEVGRRVQQSVTHERRVSEGRHARALEALSASVAHEIRNPITAAKSLVQQIAETPLAPENAEYARVAAEELDRVERSVSHLLRYAREEPIELGEVQLDEVVDLALEGLSARLKSSAARIEREATGDGWLHADKDKLRRIIVNLISNALDALDESGFPDPTVRIASGKNLSGDEVWLRISDNGPGIEAERLGKIFDPFHTSKTAGTGLGLAIARKLVEAHGGSVEARSRLGSGAEFLLTFPRHGPVT